MHTGEMQLDKKVIAGSFGRAADTYDYYADLQRDTLINLAGKETFRPDGRILDLGSGTGFGSDYLARQYPLAEIVSLDFALPMLHYAAGKYPHNANYPVCGDAEVLPFIDNSFDAVFSSLTIQWCNNYPQLFGEIHRVLRTGGKALFSTFGPDTLIELRRAWLAVDDQMHVNQFLPASAVIASAQTSKFAETSTETETVTRFYSSVGALAAELKAIGANSVPRYTGQGLTGKHRLQKLHDAFQSGEEPDMGVPVTFQIIYLALVR